MQVYRIAEKNIGITSIYEDIHRICEDYRADGAEPDFTVEISQDDIDRERSRSSARYSSSSSGYSDRYLEPLAVYRKIAERMPCYGTVLFHGSAVAVEGEAYIFAAVSGTGKSTHARLWRELLGGQSGHGK